MVDVELIKKLKAETGAGIGVCKNALDENKGDYKKAKKQVEEEVKDKVAKKSSKEVEAGILEVYTHGEEQRIAVIVEVSCQTDFVARNKKFKELAHEIALQVASMDPKFVSREDIDDSEMKKMKAELESSDEFEGKPEEIKDKIIEGKLSKKLSEICLMDQGYFRDMDKTIADLVEQYIGTLGENIKIKRFIRWQKSA